MQIFFKYIILTSSLSFCLKICFRRHYTIDSEAIFQRVELPTAEKCVERCIENLDYCRSVVYVEYKKKRLGICVVHTVNSEESATVFQPDASIDPLSNVYELLEKCPPFSVTDMSHRISPEHNRILQKGNRGSRSESQADAFIPERDRLTDEFNSKTDRYATMKSIDVEENPKNPFDSPGSEENQEPRPKSSFNSHGLTPIQPAMVYHQGKMMGRNIQNCRPGSYCPPTILMSHDAGPCPARQGDPCAPKPPCEDDDCYHLDAPPLRIPTEWTDWGVCSVSCGAGVKSRQCTGSGVCPGAATTPCILAPCQQWASWGLWSLCSASCGQGERQRTRICLGGRDCDGASTQVESCQSLPCQEWSVWNDWTGCNQSCGKGRERRNRICQHGLFCPGPAFEDRECDRGQCPEWTVWTQWSQCTKSCGGGTMIRSRDCLGGGCAGPSDETLPCNAQKCPEWVQWTSWTVCEDKCGEESYRLRNRQCLYNGVSFAGCEGAGQDQMACPVRDCPTWTEWNDWSSCTASCGQGNQIRRRECSGDGNCVGNASEMRFCQLLSCPFWSDWSQWTGCSVSCGIGVCERKRKCITDELLNLPSGLELEDAPPTDMESTEMSKAALIKRSKHIRMIMDNQTDVTSRNRRSGILDGSGGCDGSPYERKKCDAGPCCMWDGWTEWSPCIGCGVASVSRRNRQCLLEGQQRAQMPPLLMQEDPRPVLLTSEKSYVTAGSGISGLSPIVPIIHRGKRHAMGFQLDSGQCHCPGESFEEKECPAVQCAEPQRGCEWTQWGDWCGCTRCRGGRETRRRYCDRPTASDGFRSDPDCRCPGRDIDERQCRVEESCYSQAPEFGGSSRQLQTDANNRYPVDSRINRVSINSRIGSVRVTDAAASEGAGGGGRSLSAQDRYPFDRKDSTFSTTQFPYPLCRWSRWSEWSECNSNVQKQHRNRFCVGADQLVSNCECMGMSNEEQSCNNGSTVEQTERTENNKKEEGEEGRETAEAEFSTEEETEIQSSLDKVLKSADVLEVSDEQNDRVERPESRPSDESETTTSTAREQVEPQGVKDISCEWTRWSQWSDCTATCGPGEMLRKRRCPCNELGCGGGIDTEVASCEKMSCSISKEKRMHPIFSIP